MTTLGRNVKLTIPRARRATFRAAMTALGCDVLGPQGAMDLYRFEDGSMLGAEIVDDGDALPEVALEKAPWLEIVVADVSATSARLDGLGLAHVDYRDKTHAYFRAPGGVVFRLAAARA